MADPAQKVSTRRVKKNFIFKRSICHGAFINDDTNSEINTWYFLYNAITTDTNVEGSQIRNSGFFYGPRSGCEEIVVNGRYFDVLSSISLKFNWVRCSLIHQIGFLLS